jgi:hypothetical protein
VRPSQLARDAVLPQHVDQLGRRLGRRGLHTNRLSIERAEAGLLLESPGLTRFFSFPDALAATPPAIEEARDRIQRRPLEQDDQQNDQQDEPQQADTDVHVSPFVTPALCRPPLITRMRGPSKRSW